jgi:hypothetical protein
MTRFLPAAALAALLALPTTASAHDGVTISDAYARVLPGSNAGAAFMVIENHQEEGDRLVSAVSRFAERVEFHSHRQSADGMMEMIELTGGIAIPAGGTHALARGGDHVMFLGLTERLADGDVLSVTLTFERAGEVTVDVPVDNARESSPAADGMTHGHGDGSGG